MEQSQREQIKEAASRFLGDNLERVILSNPLHPEQMSKVKIRPVLLKEELCFQAEEQVGAQAFHRNLNRGEAAEYVTEKLEQAFRQCEMTSASETGLILVSKKGKPPSKSKNGPGPFRSESSRPTTGRNDIFWRREGWFPSWLIWGS